MVMFNPTVKVWIAVSLLSTCFTTPTQAVVIDITLFDPGGRNLHASMTGIDAISDRVYTLDLVDGRIIFDDGEQGAIPPSGQEQAVGSYRYGDNNSDGSIINLYPIEPGNLPLLMPITDFIDTANNEDLSFIIAGLSSMEFQFSNEGFLVTAAQVRAADVPEPTIVTLVCLSLAGIGVMRRQFRKAKSNVT
jgi:hypothetical protein